MDINKFMIYFFVCVVFLFVVGGTIKWIIPNENELDAFTKCKLDAWMNCGLSVDDNLYKMCYQLETNNDSEYEDCQIISKDMEQCWLGEQVLCYNKYYG